MLTRLSSGIDGIVVTNHAGRQVDGAIASLDALEKIVEAVGDKIYVSLLSTEVDYIGCKGKKLLI